MNLEFLNAAKVARGIQALGDANKGLSLDAVEDVANKVLLDAQRRCPVKTGKLRDSGRVLKRRTRQANKEVRAVKFGNAKAWYAAFVNYIPVDHATGEALFLDKAFLQEAKHLPQLIRARFKVRKIK